MAKASEAAAQPIESQTNVTAPTPQEFMQAPPAGFSDETRPDIKGWLRPEVGLIVYARIVGYFTFVQTIRGQTREREVVCLKVYQPTKAAVRGSDQPITLQTGEVMGASMMFALNAVKPYVEKRGIVWIKFLKKEPLGQGQFVWKAEVHCKGEKAPLTTILQQRDDGGDAAGEDSDGVPF